MSDILYMLGQIALKLIGWGVIIILIGSMFYLIEHFWRDNYPHAGVKVIHYLCYENSITVSDCSKLTLNEEK